MTAELVRSGLPPAEAARRARIALGSPLLQKEQMRASLGLRWWDEIRNDLRYGARMLRKSPGFTAVAAGSLALAIGANTTIFSFARQVLYERLAVPHARDLRLLSWTGTAEHVAIHSIWGDYDPLPGGLRTSTAFSYLAFQQLRAQNRMLEDLFAFKRTAMNATIRGTAQRIRGEMVSGNYYAQLGVRPILGRGIAPADDASPGQGVVAVISYLLQCREFRRSRPLKWTTSPTRGPEGISSPRDKPRDATWTRPRITTSSAAPSSLRSTFPSLRGAVSDHRTPPPP